MHVRNIDFWGKDDDTSTVCGLEEKEITLAYDGLRKQFYSINSYVTIRSGICEKCKEEIYRRANLP
jgi:hypothetical protein